MFPFAVFVIRIANALFSFLVFPFHFISIGVFIYNFCLSYQFDGGIKIVMTEAFSLSPPPIESLDQASKMHLSLGKFAFQQCAHSNAIQGDFSLQETHSLTLALLHTRRRVTMWERERRFRCVHFCGTGTVCYCCCCCCSVVCMVLVSQVHDKHSAVASNEFFFVSDFKMQTRMHVHTHTHTCIGPCVCVSEWDGWIK